MIFVKNCVKENNQLRANDCINQVFNSISFRKQPFTQKEMKYLKKYYTLLTIPNQICLKTILNRVNVNDISIEFEEELQKTCTDITDPSTRTEVSEVDLGNSNENIPKRNNIVPVTKLQKSEPKYSFARYWILDSIRAQHFMKTIQELPKKIFDEVEEINEINVFEKEFVMEKCEFKQRNDINENLYIPMFINVPKKLTPTQEFRIEKDHQPIIFKFFFKDDVKLGNVIIVCRPTEDQMNNGCIVFGQYKFNYIGTIGRNEPFGVFIDFTHSRNSLEFLSHFPGVEDKVSPINCIHYFSIFQKATPIEITDGTYYPDVTIMEIIPDQLTYTGIISYDLVTLYWSKISRDKKSVYSVPTLLRLLYKGYLGDFIVSQTIENKVYVHRQMLSPIGDVGQILLFDRSNAVPYGMISHNVVAMLLHYGVKPDLLFSKVEKHVSEKKITSIMTRDNSQYLYSIIDQQEPFSKALKEHINISQLLLQRHIPLYPSYRLVGVLDPYGILEPGEIAIGLVKNILISFGKTALVANNNDIHPLSLKRFIINNSKYPINDFTGCIIFSSKDPYYYVNTEFDSINFTYRRSDFIVFQEKERKEDRQDELMKLDIENVIDMMEVKQPFFNLIGRIINQTSFQQEKFIHSHLLNSLINNDLESFQSFADTFIKLKHTDKIMEVRECLFRIRKIPYSINFFGVPLDAITSHQRFNDLLNTFIEQEAKKIETLYKSSSRKEYANKQLLNDANECNEDLIQQARKQWFYYSTKLNKILKNNPNWLIEFLIGSSLRKGSQERAIEKLKNKYKLFNCEEKTRRLVALARYKVVYTEQIENETILLSPSFAFILSQELFLTKEETFALQSNNAIIHLE
ncbi:Hypothetical protein EHI5A_007360 [Entamoeba histolytica KU27]|nr:Hypothetical protein EHI5A_007360 [Entamoeba histolytica KU27]ENY64732.1 hypothetical protein EHI7A_011580 [Entamoeba histolytica HM-1:IMSS-A]